MKTRPGDVWLADLGIAGKLSPVVVVSRLDDDPPRQLVIYVPLTTKNRSSAYEVDVGRQPFLREVSVANVQGIGALPVVRMERRWGLMPAEVM